MTWYAINVVLGVLGVATTQSAAMVFKDAHSRAKNPASGTLDQRAVVTYDEMIEHAFYQGLNLAQVVYLHLVAEVMWLWARVALAMLVILPWWWRGRFPVNSFSANYRSPSTANTVVGVMYRVKKAQYLLYKHALLHGLNVSVAVAGLKLAGTPPFQSYWLLLNAAYVMEFFLQTLVRRRYMSQTTMLLLNQAIMVASTAAALPILLLVHPGCAALSMCLNFARRGHEVSNMAVVLAVALAIDACPKS